MATMWDCIILGLGRDEGRSPVADLVAGCRPGADVVIACDSASVALGEAVAQEARVASLRPLLLVADVAAGVGGAVKALTADEAVISVISDADELVVVDGRCSETLALAVDLVVAATRWRPASRLDLRAGGWVPGDPLPPVQSTAPARIRSHETARGVARAAVDLIDTGRFGDAGSVVRSAAAVMTDAADALAIDLNDIGARLELAARARLVPSSDDARATLAEELEALGDALPDGAAAILEALNDDDAAGAGVVALHTLRAALAGGDIDRAGDVAGFVARWADVVPEPVATLADRAARARGPALLGPGSDIAATIAAGVRRDLETLETGPDAGDGRHALIVADGGELPAEGLPSWAVEGAPFRSVLIVSDPSDAPAAAALATALGVRLGASPIALSGGLDDAGLTAALSPLLFAGDIVSIVAERPSPLLRSVVRSSLSLRTAVERVALGLDGSAVVPVAEIVAPLRERATAVSISRGSARARSLPGLRALGARLGHPLDMEVVATVERLDAGQLEMEDLAALERAGVAPVVLGQIAERVALPARASRVAQTWPAVRAGLRAAEPDGPRRLLALLREAGDPDAAGLAVALAAARAGSGDVDTLRLAHALGIAPGDEFDDPLDLIEDNIARRVGVPAAIVGGPDPAIALLLAVRPSGRSVPLHVDVSARLGLTIGGSTVTVDLLSGLGVSTSDGDLDARIAQDSDLGAAFRRLAVAELRSAAHPAGPWGVDAALAAAEISERLGLPDDDPMALRADRHGADAVRWLAAVPVEALIRGGRRLRDFLHADLDPLRQRLGGTPSGDSLDAWFGAWRDGSTLFEDVLSSGAEVVQLAAGPRSYALPRGISVSGLSERGARASLTPGRGVVHAEITLRRDVAVAAVAAVDAWERAAAPAAGEDDRLENGRASAVLLALVRGAAVSAYERPRLPAVWVTLFDRGRGEAVHVQRLVPDGPVLGATLPVSDAGFVLTPGPVDRVDPRETVADAFLALPGERVATAVALLGLTDEVLEPDARVLLLRAAELLLEVAHDEEIQQARTDVRRALRAAGATPLADARAAEALDGPAVDVLVEVAAERRGAARAVVRDLDSDTFAALDTPTREARLGKHASVVGLLARLDALLP